MSLLMSMAQRGKTLLCAHTNSAVDNVLLRLKREFPGLPFVRCGSSGVHSDLQAHAVSRGTTWASVAQVQEFAARHALVACTCASAGSELLVTSQEFDTVIIEEASQATECSLWAPLLRCKGRFVLVGDVKQLAPLVRSSKAREVMGTSLLERLALAHPNAVVELKEQYRMNADIETVANTLFYNHRLHSSCAVAAARLDLSCDNLENVPGWICSAVQPAASVVFVDTDPAGNLAFETRAAGVHNPFEAELCRQFLLAILQRGVSSSDVLVLSPYRQQLATLQSVISPIGDGVEFLTIDRAQGRSMRCVILSTVRSNAEHKIGDLLTDWRRLNVALTRSKHKLLVIGSLSTLETCSEGEECVEGRRRLQELVRLCRCRGWVVPVSGT